MMVRVVFVDLYHCSNVQPGSFRSSTDLPAARYAIIDQKLIQQMAAQHQYLTPVYNFTIFLSFVC
jgi:hypothetical protein